jgi:ABC-2 type transport system permease protein
MNTQSNVMPEALPQSHAAAPAAISATRQLYWLVSRELWEYRSIYIAPLAVAAVFLFGFLINTIHLPERIRTASVLTPMQRLLIEEPYNFAALLIMGTTFLVGIFYCIEALHGERRDRSILFWKSLPVSDLTTVLSKACIPLVVLPLLTFLITVAMQWLMLLLGSAVLMGSGMSAAPLWTNLSLFQTWLMLLYHLLAIHSLWYAPIFAWLLLVSAWARRAPFLWAALPPLAIGVVEKIAFGTSHFATMLQHRIGGGSDGAVSTSNSMSMDPFTLLTLGRFLVSPGLWIGLGLAAIFLAAAVRLRRYRGPI